LSGKRGEVIYDTTNSNLLINENNDNLITTLDYKIGLNAATTAANTVASGDINFTITGGTAGDTITSGGGADTIDGGTGADTINGGAGNDALTGGAGADTFTIGAGADTIADLGAGNTTAEIVTVAAGSTVVATMTGNYTAPAGTQNLGSVAADFSIIASNAEILDLDLATVTTAATDGFTVTSTSTGAITGSDGADTITNTSGSATIIGGAAADAITGGTGTDIIKYTSTTSTLMAVEAGSAVGSGNTAGTIATFTSGTDKLHFSSSLVNNNIDSDVLKVIVKGGTVAANDTFVHVSNTAIGDAVGTIAGAVTIANALITTTVAQNEDIIIAMDDDTNTYLWLLTQLSTADTVAAQDLTLIGTLTGITTVTNGDFVSY